MALYLGSERKAKVNVTMIDRYREGYNAGYNDVMNDLDSIMTSVSGNMIVVNDVFNSIHELDVQLTSSTITDFSGIEVSRLGKNLLEYPYIETTLTRNGVTFTDNGDGTITVNGTATADTQFRLQDTVLYPNGYNPFKYLIDESVVIEGSPSGSSKDTYGIQSIHVGIVGNARYKITDSRYRFAILIKSGITVNNLVFKPVLYLSSTMDNIAFQQYDRRAVLANADGTVKGLTSVSPNMTLLTNSDDVIINLKYFRDTKTALENQAIDIAMSGGE